MFKKLLVIFLLLSACSHRADVEEKIYRQGFDTNNLKFSTVYIQDDKIYIQSFYRNNFRYFVGDILNIKMKHKVDTRVFLNRIIELKALGEDEGAKKFEELKKSKKAQKLDIIEYDVWADIIIPVLEKVIISIVPKEKDRAVVVAVANRDMAIFYDDDNMITIKKVEKLKKNISITRIYNEKEFYDLISAEIKKSKAFREKSMGEFIIFELRANDDMDSPYVLFDNNTDMQYYFDFSNVFKARQGFSNIDYYLQILFNTVIKSHIIEPIKNPITTVSKASTFVYQNLKKSFESSKIKNLNKIPPLNTNGEMMDINVFEKDLDKLTGKKKYKGTIEYLIGGTQFFTDLLNEIEKSQNEIFIRLYIFSNDDYGVRIANILKNKDKKGVDIRVLTGGLANNAESMKRSSIPFDKDFKQPRSIGQYLAFESNVNFRTSADTFFMFDHSKMIVIDGKVAYVGGMNIGQPYRYSWHDMMVKLKGPIVYQIRKDFTKAWASAGIAGDFGKFTTSIKNTSNPPKDLQKYYDSLNKDKEIDIRILYTKPQKKTIYKSQMHAIKNAKKFIYIENPYLADFKIINALIEARGRGVDVRVILPAKNNVGMMASSNLVATNIFLKNGIRVFKYPGMTHVKAAIYDGWATLGSANFDNLSLMINEEFNIGFSNPEYVNRLKKELFEVDFALSTEVKEPYVINLYDKVMSGFANRF